MANSDTGEPEDLFVQQALSSRPPAAFQRPSSSPVFFYPDHPINPLKWKVKFGGEPIVPLYQSPEPAARSGSVPSPKVTHMSNASTCAQPLSDQPASITESQNISFVPSLSNQNSPSAAAAAVNYDINNKHAGVITMSIQTESNADNDVSFAADQQYKGVAPVQKTSTYVGTRQDHASGFSNEKSTEQSTYMKPMLKDYLDDLGGMSHLNIDGGKSQYGGLQASSTQTQQPTNNSPFSQMQTNTSTQHQMGKVPPTHSSIHVTHPQNVPASTQSHQQQQTAATLPPGMPHFIGQFPTPYHMFNLPGGTNSGTTLLDLEQLQFYQHLHMQQQAATTAQSYLSPPVDAPSVSKAPIHGMPTSMSHVTAANQGMRPEMLASAMSHAPQMMAAGHTYPYYPGFVLMVSR